MKQALQMTSVAVFILFAAMISEAGTLRATDLDNATWSRFFAGKLPEVLIEFRQGDRLPVTLTAEGDFFETQNPQSTPLNIKKDFWMKVVNNDVQFSLNGTDFKPLPQMAKGQFNVGANADDSSGGRANGINMNIQAYQK